MKRLTALLLCMLMIGVLKQAAAQTDDHGGTCETATMAEPMSSTTGELTPDDIDSFVVEMPAGGGRLNAGTLGTTNTAGELFQIVSGIPIPIASNGDNAGNQNFFISQTVDEGTYCIQVSGQSASIQGPYILQVEADLPDDEHGNNCETATNVGQPMISGELSVFADSDFFRIQVPPGGGNLTVSTLGPTNTAGELFQILDGIPIPIASNGDNAGNPNFLISRMVDEGTYCVEVSGQTSSIQGPYIFQTSGDFIPAGSCAAENVRLSVASIDFGPVLIGDLAEASAITVTNISTDSANVLFLDASFLEDMDAADFGIVNDTCAGQMLMPGAQCTLRAVFSPLDAGPKTAAIIIPCNDPDSLPLEVELLGEGTMAP